MMTDDWRLDLADHWYNTEAWEWRNDADPAPECPTEPNPDVSLDITGAPLRLLCILSPAATQPPGFMLEAGLSLNEGQGEGQAGEEGQGVAGGGGDSVASCCVKSLSRQGLTLQGLQHAPKRLRTLLGDTLRTGTYNIARGNYIMSPPHPSSPRPSHLACPSACLLLH